MSQRLSKKSPEARTNLRFVLSLHDVSPGSRRVFAPFLEHLNAIGIHRTSLLVVPRWHNGPPFTACGEFVEWLRDMEAAGHDICLHGWNHLADRDTSGPASWFVRHVYTAGEDEFFQLGKQEAARRLADGLALFREAGLSVHGFTPPAWLISEAARRVVRKAGLVYNTTFTRIELLQAQNSLPAPVVALSCRSAWRRRTSRAWSRLWAGVHSRQPILRLAVHPLDLQHKDVTRALLAVVRSALPRREACSYRDVALEAQPEGVRVA